MDKIEDMDMTGYSMADYLILEEASEDIQAMLDQTIPVMQTMFNLL